MLTVPAEIIKKKREGQTISDEEIESLIGAFVKGDLPEYQMSALLMAIYFKGLDNGETLALTKAIINSGRRVHYSDSNKKVDKHSTGGVGDKTTLILAPIVAAAGVSVPTMSGRGLGHTGGTLDKLESIPGFRTQITIDDLVKQIKKFGLCFLGQTEEICPADKKMYALRDVTATVESLPLICASIMSKKIAEGIDGLVLDVKTGSGAFMKDPEQSEALARALLEIARGYNVRAVAYITDMNQPLGRFAGNALEVLECLEILKGKSFMNSYGYDSYRDTKELSLQLAGTMIFLGDKVANPQEGYELAAEILASGAALKKFETVCAYQSGELNKIPEPKFKLDVLADKAGFISEFQNEKIGWIGVGIRAGRSKISDTIDPTAGIEFHSKIGDAVKVGDSIFTLYGNSLELLSKAQGELSKTVTISLQKPELPSLIKKIIWDRA